MKIFALRFVLFSVLIFGTDSLLLATRPWQANLSGSLAAGLIFALVMRLFDRIERRRNGAKK